MGDQIVALKNTISLPRIDTSTSLINDTSEQEALLNFVQRLASWQHYPQRQVESNDSKEKFFTEKNNNVVYNNSDICDNEQLHSLIKSCEKTKFSQIKKNVSESAIVKDSEVQIDELKFNMGSNVSRHSGKGLSGRRTQSSGNLCNENQQTSNGSYNTPNNKRKAENGKPNAIYQKENIAESCSVNTATKLMMAPLCVGKKDRNKFCGSLPNHLDADDMCEENVHNYSDNNNTLAGVEYVTVAPRKYHTPQPVESSPHNNSSSEKESTSSSTNLGSTFRTNHENKPDIQLKLPINRSNFDIGCDQGYGSERSPEDELPPPLPLLSLPYQPLHQPQWNYDKYNGCEYSFITQDCCFEVKITKDSGGLGLSVSGGVDTNAAFPGLIRIKRLFPHQVAWCTGMLQPGDILLAANQIALTGLTNYEALEVLRTTPNVVTLTVCRPRDEQYRKLSPPTEPPKPPQRTHPNSLPLEPLFPIQTYFSGEFEIIMVKQQGSLGFTLRKEDESVLGHYVRALVREPATTDGRIKPGDKIVAVNDVPLCPMTHEEAVIFLRQAADTVKLRLYRDDAQTPIAAMSPSHNENKTICSNVKQKVCLRPEAINLLSDLAYRNKKHQPGPDSSGSSIRSNNTSPRRLRRGNKTSSSNTSQNETDKTDSKSFTYPKYIVSSQSTSVYSDSETSTISQCSYVGQNNPTNNSKNITFDIPEQNNTNIPLDWHSSTFVIPEDCNSNSEFYGEDELWKAGDECDCNDGINRPSYLDLAGNIGSTPVVSRKPKFQFSVAANAYELNNLDNEALDAPIYTTTGATNIQQRPDENNQDFISLPCETFLVACRTENDLNSTKDSFNHKNPVYQSAHVQVTTTDAAPTEVKKGGTKSLLKWKGVMFSSDEEKETPEADLSCAATVGTNPTPGTEKDLDFNGLATDGDGHKILTVELNRGWNSRLGFSLQNDPNRKNTFISAIYNDSVAARDGRLKVGDQVLMVNEESVQHMPTTEIIDLLRIVRGSISVTVLRKDV